MHTGKLSSKMFTYNSKKKTKKNFITYNIHLNRFYKYEFIYLQFQNSAVSMVILATVINFLKILQL